MWSLGAEHRRIRELHKAIHQCELQHLAAVFNGKTQSLKDRAALINGHGEDGNAPLPVAVMLNFVDGVHLLLQKGADPRTIDKFGTLLSVRMRAR